MKEHRIPLCVSVGLHAAAITLIAIALHKVCCIHKGLHEIRKGFREIEEGKKEMKK